MTVPAPAFALLVALVAAGAIALVAAPLFRRTGRATQSAPRPPARWRRPEWLLGAVVVAAAAVLLPAVLVSLRTAPPQALPGSPADTAAPPGAPPGASPAGASPARESAPLPPGDAVVEGLVVNGTSGAPAAGQVVVLTVADPAAGPAERQTIAGHDGRFRFADVDGTAAYELVIARGSVAYRSGAFRPLEVNTPVELRAYDPTDRDPGLRVERAVLVISAVDARRREIVADEFLTVVNPSVQTYVPGPAAGPMGLLRFSLPAGAYDLTPTYGLRPEETVQVDRGFAVLGAVTPGAHEYGFSFRFPYAAGTHALSLSWPYGVGALRVLTPPEGPAIAGPQVTPQGATSLGDRPYRVWAVEPLQPGARLALELRALPAPPLPLLLVEALARPWAAALVVAGLALMVAGWKLRPAKGAPRAGRVRLAPNVARAARAVPAARVGGR